MFLLAAKDLVFIASFKLFQDQIAEKWCINKFEPDLMCFGQCFLDQQLSDLNGKNQQQSSIIPANQFVKLLYVKESAPAFTSINNDNISGSALKFYYQHWRERLYTTAVFIPPDFLA